MVQKLDAFGACADLEELKHLTSIKTNNGTVSFSKHGLNSVVEDGPILIVLASVGNVWVLETDGTSQRVVFGLFLDIDFFFVDRRLITELRSLVVFWSRDELWSLLVELVQILHGLQASALAGHVSNKGFESATLGSVHHLRLDGMPADVLFLEKGKQLLHIDIRSFAIVDLDPSRHEVTSCSVLIITLETNSCSIGEPLRRVVLAFFGHAR